MTQLSRRSLITGLGALGISGALTGCGGSTSGAASNEVSFANWSDNFADLYTETLDAYEAQADLTLVRQADVPFDDYQTRFRTLLSGGQPPGVMRLNDDFVREMTDKNQLADLRERIRSTLDDQTYFGEVRDFTALEAGQGGLAIGSSPRVLFYNKTLLGGAGITPPTSWSPDGWRWDDVLAAAREVTTGDTYGICVWTDTGFENTWAVNNGGPGIFSEDGTAFTLADPEGVEAIQWVVDLANNHEVQPSWADLQSEDADLRLFTSGRLGMFFGTLGLAAYMRENVTEFEWDVAPAPAQVEQRQEGSLAVFVVPEQSADVDHGWDLLQWLVGQESGKIFASAGALIPLNRAAAEQVETSATQGENMALFAEAAANQATVNSTRATAQAVQLYRPQLERAYIGEITVADALTGVRAQVERVLG